MTRDPLAAIVGEAVAVVIVREGRLPAGADEAVAEAGGLVVVAGSGAEEAAGSLPSAVGVWWCETLVGLAALASALAPELAATTLVVLPASPDGRDLAPRLAAVMGRPLLAGSSRCSVADGGVEADLVRVEGRVCVPAVCAGPAVATLLPGARTAAPSGASPRVSELFLEVTTTPGTDPETLGLVEPDPATMDLAEAPRVIGGGAGLVRRDASDAQARALFALMAEVAAALGASAGATRVVTDAGWMGSERQIGTTGVAIDPAVYIALGVSGASQHVGGLGSPAHTVSVNTDPSCPMTSMADLGLVTDAAGLLLELARRLGVTVPAELMAATS